MDNQRFRHPPFPEPPESQTEGGLPWFAWVVIGTLIGVVLIAIFF